MSWSHRMLELAKHHAGWSKDKTQVGAVAWDQRTRDIIQPGYNGPPRGVDDLPERIHERPGKYLFMSHAEENVISNAARKGVSLDGCTITVTHFPCCACARMIINSGIREVHHGDGKTSMPEEQFEAARQMFHEAGVTVRAVQ